MKNPDLTPIDVLDHNILTLCTRINAATYELLVMIREFDERAGWLIGTMKPDCSSLHCARPRCMSPNAADPTGQSSIQIGAGIGSNFSANQHLSAPKQSFTIKSRPSPLGHKPSL
jgi:hypothetical protein